MRKLTVAIAALLVPAAALAGGYVVPNTNARDLAMSGSAAAAQDTAAATYASPPSLSKLEGLNISADVSLIDFRSTWSDPTGAQNPVTMTPKGAFPFAIYAAYGFKLPDSLAGMRGGVGAGATIPGGGYVFWPGQWFGREEIVTVDRKVYGMYLTAGLQVLPQLRVGGGLVYYRTTEHLIQGLNFGSTSQIELGTAGGAFSYDLSAEVTPIPEVPLTVAVDYKHQGVMSLTGHAHGSGIPPGLVPNLLDQGVQHTLTYPNQLNVGAAYQVIPQLLLTFGWTWERFHVYKQDLFAGDRGVTVVVPRDYKNGYTLRFGGELQAIPKLKVRAGFLHDTSPARPETYSATLPDSDVWAFSLGAGYEVIPNLEVNAAYFHAFYDKVTTVGTEVFPATYDTRANIYAINVTWKMGAAK